MLDFEYVPLSDDTIRPYFQRWVSERTSAKTLLTIEGLWGAGKTTLSESIGVKQSALLALDDYGKSDVLHSTQPYIKQLKERGALVDLSARLRQHRMVVVEGLVAAPLVSAIDLSEHVHYAVYVLRLSKGDWDECNCDILRSIESPPLNESILRYHCIERPWLHSDLILARCVDD